MSKNPNSPSTGHASNPSAIPAPMQPPRSLPKQNKVWSRFNRRIQAIPLSTKLVTCIIVLLTIGTIEGGNRFYAVANHVHMEGVTRASSADLHEKVMRQIIENTA